MSVDGSRRRRARARAWRDADPDPATRARLDALLDRGDDSALAELFDRPLAFGTAGLRGPLGPGPGRMNRLVVRRAAAAVSRVVAHRVPGAAARGVVVAHDARHGSARFAADAVEVVVSHGLDVHVLDGPAPTPLAAFALRHLGAAAALVVTASHNPAADNGLKVYWSDGAQIVPPIDAEVAAAIDAVPGDGAASPGGAVPPGTVHHLGGATGGHPVVLAYLDEALRLVPGPPAVPVPLAVTSLHGVGALLLERVLAAAGHGPVHAVTAQREPDPDFPTVAAPNPEEPGALDAVLELAERVGAAAALANDPDADRLALAAPDGDGHWHVLTGDELGAVLAHHLLSLTDGVPDRLVVTTVVSSGLLARMADAAGVHHAETLTGFKWLCRPGLAHPAWRQVLCYEEALGYAAGPEARDKDGITAALVAADLVAVLRAEGRTVWDVLDDLARRHGAHVTDNGSVALGDGAGDGAARAAAVVEGLAASPPASLGGRAVVGDDRPAPEVLRWWLEDGTRVVVRPSGTEPRLKRYCEAVEPVGPPPDTPAGARERARTRLAPVVADLDGLLLGG